MGDPFLLAQVVPPPASSSVLLLSWEQVAAIVVPLVSGLLGLFWLLIREMERGRKRAEEKEDQQGERLLSTLEQLVATNKQMLSMFEHVGTRGPRD